MVCESANNATTYCLQRDIFMRNEQFGKNETEGLYSVARSNVTLEEALQLADMIVVGLDANDLSYENKKSIKYDIMQAIHDAVNDARNQLDPELLFIGVLSVFLRESYLGDIFQVDIMNSKTGLTLIPRGRKTPMYQLRRLASNHMDWAVNDPELAKDLSLLKETVLSKCKNLHHYLRS